MQLVRWAAVLVIVPTARHRLHADLAPERFVELIRRPLALQPGTGHRRKPASAAPREKTSEHREQLS